MTDKTIEEAQRLLETARTERDPLWRKLCVVAAITRALEETPIRPVVIGGTAVAFYTFGGYTTEDVDLAVVGRERFAEALAALGFRRMGRLLEHPAFDFCRRGTRGCAGGRSCTAYDNLCQRHGRDDHWH